MLIYKGVNIKKIFDTLKRDLYNTAELNPDSRFGNRSWCKFIDSIDESKTNGYCIEGDFISDGTIEIEIKPRLLLAKAQSGSRNNNYGNYAVVMMDSEGNLHKTDIETDDSTPGWALRIRDKIKSLLDNLESIKIEDLDKRKKKFTKKGEFIIKMYEIGRSKSGYGLSSDLEEYLFHTDFHNDLWIYDESDIKIESNDEVAIPDELKD